ncbi:hypothetical protein Tco_0809641, partial [Tanacetum coccineum]
TNKDAKDCQGGNKRRDNVDKGEKKGKQYLWFLAGCEDRVTEKDVQLFPGDLKFGKLAKQALESV